MPPITRGHVWYLADFLAICFWVFVFFEDPQSFTRVPRGPCFVRSAHFSNIQFVATIGTGSSQNRKSHQQLQPTHLHTHPDASLRKNTDWLLQSAPRLIAKTQACPKWVHLETKGGWHFRGRVVPKLTNAQQTLRAAQNVQREPPRASKCLTSMILTSQNPEIKCKSYRTWYFCFQRSFTTWLEQKHDNDNAKLDGSPIHGTRGVLDTWYLPKQIPTNWQFIFD